MSFFLSILLCLPFLSLSIYFFKKRDPYFYKTRPTVQLLVFISILISIFLELLFWKIFDFLACYNFLGISIQDSNGINYTTPTVTIMTGIAAVIGWLFTSRVQMVGAGKTHAMQVLMNSRTSAEYVKNVQNITNIKNESELEQHSQLKFKFLPLEIFNKLELTEKSSIHYMLNFLEFIAVGIRHNNLNEELMKGSYKSILKNNCELFSEVISDIQSKFPSNYKELLELNKRWQKPD